MHLDRRLRMNAALAHSAPGTNLSIRWSDGSETLVAANHLDAHLDPCRFRCVLLTADSTLWAEAIDAVVVVGGLHPIGADVYERRLPGGHHETWFVTLLDQTATLDVLGGCPSEIAGLPVGITLRPDRELGATVVRLRSGCESPRSVLDRASSWVAAALMIGELLADVTADSIR